MLNKLIEHIIKGLRNEPPIIQDPLTPAHNLQNQGQLLQNQRTFGIIQDITGIGTIWPR